MTKLVLFDRPEYPISTHTPLTGRDVMLPSSISSLFPFLLTRPLRDVTYRLVYPHQSTKQFLLTRPLRDVTLLSPSLQSLLPFLLTRPLRDVTYDKVQQILNEAISTHTPLTGRDDNLTGSGNGDDDFYSHAPYGT